MGKSATSSADYLKLIYNGSPIANIADNAATSPLTNIYLALHTADPGTAGTASTNEVAYTNYARVAVARTTAGFTLTGTSVALAALQSFPAGTGGSGTALFFSTSAAATGAAKIFHSGPLGAVLGDFTAATSGTITIPAHSLAVGNTVCFEPPTGAGSLPTGITAGTLYYVITAPTVDTITVSTTSGGSAVAITASGDGVAYKVQPITLGSGVTPQLGTGTTITES